MTNTKNNQNQMLQIFQALSDPIRLDIVNCLLVSKEKRLSSEDYDVAKSTLSHHLKILKDAEIITTKKEGVTHIYSVNNNFTLEYPELIETLQIHREQNS